MNPFACAVLVLLAASCATAPAPQPTSPPHDFEAAPSSDPLVQFVSGDLALEQPRIGKADLDEARALLSRARQELEPRHWELLDRKLTAAEQAWERLFLAARTNAHAAEVPRGVRSQAGRPGSSTGTLSRVGPLLLALALLWPSDTAGPEQNSRPPWADAQREFEARLRDVSESSRQLMAELESLPPPAHTKARQPQPAPGHGSPPPALTRQGRPECQPVPVPHRGGDAAHDRCADEFPPNRFPGHDVLVDGKRFDALQVGVRVLWEIKTDRFDTYSPDLRKIVSERQVPELLRELGIAEACGYGFVVGVSSAAHKADLERLAPELNIVVTGCT